MRRILFLCTGNSARSQMAEALVNHHGAERFEAVSAGSRPAGYVHPVALQVLDEVGIVPDDPRSKPWTEFEDAALDAVITLCGSARDEICPHWPLPLRAKLPVRAHWGFDDPVRAISDGEEAQVAAFRRTRDAILALLQELLGTDPAILDDDEAFAARVQELAR